jgi:hypothetical protein
MLSWSGKKIAQLKTQVDNSGLRDLERDIARAKLHVLDGAAPAARALLWRAATALNGQRNPADQAAELTVAAIIASDFALARSLIRRYFAPRVIVKIGVERHTQFPTTAVVWEICDRAACHFVFDPYMFQLDHTELFLQRWLDMLPVCVHYLHSETPEPGKICINLDDKGSLRGLAFCDNRPDFFLIPDPGFVRSRGYSDIRDRFSALDVPWEQRAPVAFWRGGTSGSVENRELGWKSLPRIRLCEISMQHPKIVDAGISAVAQIPDIANVREIHASGLMRAYVPPTEIIRFRYQIDIDGNTNAWAGLFQKLLSGSAVLKVASPGNYRQWYYDELRPWRNFVPVESDLSDLVEKVLWLRTHDAHAREIGRRGKELAQSLSFDSELQRSETTITGAIREIAGHATHKFMFGTGEPGNHCLRDCWSVEEAGAAWATGIQSTLEIPRPPGRGQYVLDLVVSPFRRPPGSSPQELAVAINGDVVNRLGVVGKQTVRCPVPMHAVQTSGALQICLLHPQAMELACTEFPLDERAVAFQLHQAILVAHEHAAAIPAPVIAQHATGGSAPPFERPVSRQQRVMLAIHSHDVWHGFAPSRPRQDPIQGWNGIHPSFQTLLEQVTNPTFIDVGAWKGQATVFVAGLMQKLGLDGCVIAIDTFLGAASHWTAKKEWFARLHGRPDLYETFLDNVMHNKVSDLVVPFPQTPIAAAFVLRQRGINAGIVHIDGAADHRAVLAEAEAYWPLIESGGFLVGDDYHETWPSVMRAAEEFTQAHCLNLIVAAPKWIVQKTA